MGFFVCFKSPKKESLKSKQNASIGLFFPYPKSDLMWIFLNVAIPMCGNRGLDFVTSVTF